VFLSVSTNELIQICSVSTSIEAWEEFVRRFHRVIAAVVLRTAERFGDSSPETVDDLIQETYFKLCANNCQLLRDFQAHHPDAFFGFIKTVAANLVRDHFKSIYSQRRGRRLTHDTEESGVVNAVAGGTGTSESIVREILLREINGHLKACAASPDHPRNCRIFWLYYRAGLSAGAIAALPEMGLTTKGVESVIKRLTKALRERMDAPMRETSDAIQTASKGILPAESF
jgi:RNA polymerase sigma-70 factor, ECF subfamily